MLQKAGLHWRHVVCIISSEMRTVEREFWGQTYLLREHDRGGLVLDSIMRKLAHHVADDYCNPPGFAWAVIIFEPGRAIESVVWRPKELWPPLTHSERQFLERVRAAIVKVGRRSEVTYYDSARAGWEAWLRLKQEAEQWGFEKKSGT